MEREEAVSTEFEYGTMFWVLHNGLRDEPATGLLSDQGKAAIVEAALSAVFPDPKTDLARARSASDWADIYTVGIEQVGVLDAFSIRYQNYIIRALVKHTPKKAKES
jgi:hypothetical protein